jgi:hypothetical protein
VDLGTGARALGRPLRHRGLPRGSVDVLDRALAEVAERYAHRKERDYQALIDAVE